ncbi:hypothetical protein ACFUTR_29150 [Streptomyces sp. NPDC057367]|uniref:hypothetical protein n=1 Tax=Streptomyces sp. NPDC057367 TaxID=3346108 RepID=UPI003628704B
MVQTKFDKQLEENADSLVRGIARVLAGRDLDGVKRTDVTFWRAGTRVLPKAEGKVRRRYKPGWRRLSFRIGLGAGVGEIGYLATQDLDATVQNTQELLDHREQVLATLESGGIGGACVLTVGTAAYMALTRERRKQAGHATGPGNQIPGARLGRAGLHGHTTVSGPWEDRSRAKPSLGDNS